MRFAMGEILTAAWPSDDPSAAQRLHQSARKLMALRAQAPLSSPRAFMYLGARLDQNMEFPITVDSIATPLTVLRAVFGYEDFRPGQLKVIEAVLDGRDCIALMPTGAGKSLTFQVPARILEGTVLVVRSVRDRTGDPASDGLEKIRHNRLVIDT